MSFYKQFLQTSVTHLSQNPEFYAEEFMRKETDEYLEWREQFDKDHEESFARYLFFLEEELIELWNTYMVEDFDQYDLISLARELQKDDHKFYLDYLASLDD